MHRDDAGVIPLGGVPQFGPAGRIGSGSGPDFARVKRVHQRREAADVILVAVGGCDHIERADTASPEVGSHHVFARVEAAAGLASVAGEAAAIHEHALAVGERDEDAIALADVDDGHLSRPGSTSAGNGLAEKQCEQAGHAQERG